MIKIVEVLYILFEVKPASKHL